MCYKFLESITLKNKISLLVPDGKLRLIFLRTKVGWKTNLASNILERCRTSDVVSLRLVICRVFFI